MQLSAGAVILLIAMLLLLGMLVAYASGVGRRAHEEPGEMPTGNPSMERKVVVTLGLLIISGILLTGYSFVEPQRQAEAQARQDIRSIDRGIENFTTLCIGCHGIDGTGAVVPGTGSTPLVAPALNRPDLRPDPNDKDAYNERYNFVNKTIHRGRTGTPMPAWGRTDGGPLLDEQIHELTLLITRGETIVEGKKTAWEKVTEVAKEKIAHGAPEPQRPTLDIGTLSPDEAEGAKIFTGKGGCVGCHNAGTGGGATGPNLAHIGTDGGNIKPGMDAAAYIEESIRSPQAYIVAGYPPVMPPNFSQILSDQEIKQLVAFLLSRK
ncbi:MAG: cytochrome c [Chloroflexota bacterium]